MENNKRFWKVIKDGKVIDVLDKLVYLKWQPKNKIMVLSCEDEAQAFLSSGNNDFYHERTLYRIPDDTDVKYETVELIEISKFEYEKLRVLNLKTPEEIIDAFVISLLEENII